MQTFHAFLRGELQPSAAWNLVNRICLLAFVSAVLGIVLIAVAG